MQSYENQARDNEKLQMVEQNVNQRLDAVEHKITEVIKSIESQLRKHHKSLSDAIAKQPPSYPKHLVPHLKFQKIQLSTLQLQLRIL